MSDYDEYDQDDEDPDSLRHVCDHVMPAKAQKQRDMLRHLNKFLDIHSERLQDTPKLSETVKALIREHENDAEHLPHEVISSEAFVGNFLSYLGTEATWLRNPTKLLSSKTCMGYASSFAEFYKAKYCDHEAGLPKPITDYSWVRKIRSLQKTKSDQMFNGTIEMSQPKSTMTGNELKFTNEIAILDGTAQGGKTINLFLFQNIHSYSFL